MLGLSRLVVTRPIGLMACRLRAVLSAPFVTAAAPLSSGSRLLVLCDLSDADQEDPTKTLTVVTEISVDGGAQWRLWCAFTTAGTPRQADPGWPQQTQPFVEVPMPPVGALVRTTVTPGAQPVTAGVTVRAA